MYTHLIDPLAEHAILKRAKYVPGALRYLENSKPRALSPQTKA